MCLDDVLGFINPESQMPNTVLLAGAGGAAEGGAEVLQGSESGENQNGVASIKSCNGGPGPGTTRIPRDVRPPAYTMGLQQGQVTPLGRLPGGWGRGPGAGPQQRGAGSIPGGSSGHKEAQSW